MNETSRNQGRAIAAAAAGAALLFVIGILNGSYLALALPVAIVTLFALGLDPGRNRCLARGPRHGRG